MNTIKEYLESYGYTNDPILIEMLSHWLRCKQKEERKWRDRAETVVFIDELLEELGDAI